MSEFKYLTTSSPTLTIKLAGKRWQSVGGLLNLSADAAKELDALMETRSDIRAMIQKIDMAKAEAIAKTHMEKMRAQPAAVKGPFTSMNAASNVLREARQAQTSEALTGQSNPVNIKTNAKDDKPLEVTQVPITTPPPTGSLFSKMKQI